jgi:hypothetical protein
MPLISLSLVMSKSHNSLQLSPTLYFPLFLLVSLTKPCD